MRSAQEESRYDAKALLEAARNADIDPVPVKSIDQQAIAALHRLRQGYLRTRTARINSFAGCSASSGVILPLGAKRVVGLARRAIEQDKLPRICARPC
ncbi:MAG: hypothetical protein R3E98_15550 [Gemmatimonadota bacterium]